MAGIADDHEAVRRLARAQLGPVHAIGEQEATIGQAGVEFRQREHHLVAVRRAQEHAPAHGVPAERIGTHPGRAEHGV